MAVYNPDDDDVPESADLVALGRLQREVRESAQLVGRDEARFLVSLYYLNQEHRIALDGQERSLVAADKPADVVHHFARQIATLERQMTSVLDAYSMGSMTGQWARAQTGVGPILASGFLAHVDIEQAPTVGHVWSFFGLNPTVQWLSRARADKIVADLARLDEEHVAAVCVEHHLRFESVWKVATTKRDGSPQTPTAKSVAAALAKRPWNAEGKVLAWRLGDSFCKQSGRDEAFYGHIYRDRKEQEVFRNEQRLFADQAAVTLQRRRINDATLRKTYEDGKLPPGRLELRARRYATKLFLAHFHEVLYVEQFGALPPKPYVLTLPGHTHEVVPPHLPEPVKALRSAAGRPVEPATGIEHRKQGRKRKAKATDDA